MKRKETIGVFFQMKINICLINRWTSLVPTHVQLSLASRSVQIEVDLKLAERRVKFIVRWEFVQCVCIPVCGFLQSSLPVQCVPIFQ